MTLEYQSSEDLPRRRRIFSLSAFWMTALPLVVIYAVVFLLAPRVEKTYADFGVALPGVTMAVLAFSRWALRFGWMWVAVLPFAFGIIVPLFIQPNPNRPPRARLAPLLFINALLLLALILIVIALVLPYYTMMDNLSGQL